MRLTTRVRASVLCACLSVLDLLGDVLPHEADAQALAVRRQDVTLSSLYRQRGLVASHVLSERIEEALALPASAPFDLRDALLIPSALAALALVAVRPLPVGRGSLGRTASAGRSSMWAVIISVSMEPLRSVRSALLPV